MMKIISMFTGIGPTIAGLSLGTKALIFVGVLVAGGFTYGSWRASLVKEGEDRAIAEIAKGNAKMIERAMTARGRVNACYDLNREWDVTTGECK